MSARVFPLIASRLAELTQIPCDATILCAGADADIATLTASPSSLPAMVAALRTCRRALNPGGAVAFVSLGKNALQPLAGLCEARMRSYGVKPADLTSHPSRQQLTDPETCHDLLREAGFENIEVRVEQLGFHLQSADEWWDIVSNSSLRGAMSRLSPDQLAQFKVEHLAEISALSPSSGNGIWLDVPAIFAVGHVITAQSFEQIPLG